MSPDQYRIHIYQRGAPITLALIIINCLVYGAGLFLAPGQAAELIRIFGLSAPGMSHGAYWQLLTYAFLHGSILHLTFNMIGLWFVGREVEIVLGGGKYLFLYFTGGIIGGVAQVLLIGSPSGTEIVGASGCVFAVMIAFTTLYPNVVVTALIFFVVPLRMKARYLGWLVVGVTVLFWVSGMGKGIAHMAHLGGCAVGFALGLLWKRGMPPFPLEDEIPPPPQHTAPVRTLPPPSTGIQKILHKIANEGFDSLNAEERHLLETHRNQLSRSSDIPKSELDQ